MRRSIGSCPCWRAPTRSGSTLWAETRRFAPCRSVDLGIRESHSSSSTGSTDPKRLSGSRCRGRPHSLERDDAADRFAFVHEIEGIVYAVERHPVRDEVVDPNLTVHVPVHDLRHVAAPLGAAEGRTAPDAPGDELERAGGDFFAGTGDADDGALAPSFVAALERGTHRLGFADALERIVRAAFRQIDQVRDEIPEHF